MKKFIAKAEYTGDLHTDAVHLASQATLSTDAPTDNRGKGESFSPTDLVSTALMTCILTIMGITAQDKGINIKGIIAKVTKHMKSDPRRIARIEVIITMPSSSYTVREKKLLEAAALHCPVSCSLNPDLQQEIKIIWPEE